MASAAIAGIGTGESSSDDGGLSLGEKGNFCSGGGGLLEAEPHPTQSEPLG